jgi:hypothetical protein
MAQIDFLWFIYLPIGYAALAASGQFALLTFQTQNYLLCACNPLRSYNAPLLSLFARTSCPAHCFILLCFRVNHPFKHPAFA